MAARSSMVPLFEVYLVCPACSEAIPASRIGFGVTKSGSPTPSEIIPSTEAIRSKNFRIPEGDNRFTRCEISRRCCWR